MIDKALKIFAVLAVLTAGAYGLQSKTACATGIADQTCDTNVWQTMATRARLETEREIMQNQNLIFKPDSILNYVCFDKFAGHAAKNIGVLFSETTFFTGSEIAKGSTTPKAVQDVVVAGGMTPYLTNFNHNLLGGRGDKLGLSKPAVTASATSYSCSTMSQVWAAAKCMNFIHDSAWKTTDGFFPFKTLNPLGGGDGIWSYSDATDVRKYPSACGSSPFSADGGSWSDLYDESRNYRNSAYDRLYQYGTPNQNVFKSVQGRIDPGSCSGNAIKTGLTVILGPSSATTHADGVCTNPGCRLSKSGTCE